MKPEYYALLLVLGALLVFASPSSPNYALYVTVGNLVFWTSLAFMLFKTVMRRPFTYVWKKANKVTLAVFPSYLAVHYFAYSVALERLLTDVYGPLFSVTSPFLSFGATYFPQGAYSTVVNLLFNPYITAGFPPNYYLQLSFYALYMGFIIASLVTANIMRAVEIAGRLGRAKVIILAPLLGVIGGGSCCISIPILLATAIPSANVIFFSPVGDTALFLAYLLLPPLTAVGLKLNYDAMTPKPPRELRLNLKEAR